MNKERTIEHSSNHVHSKSLRATISTALGRFLCALFLISGHYASADDISAITPIQHKPNVLLVLDYSQSMDQLLNGEVKIDSLRTAVHGVIDQFSSEINIGIGSLFRQEAGGIIWPVSDLSQPANFVDPRITDLSITARDVVKNIVDEARLGIGTASTPALVEAAQYFRGGDVIMGGVDPENVLMFEPRTWDPSIQSYTGNRFSSHISSYTPSDAYTAGGAPDSTGFCEAYDANIGPNYCKGIDRNDCSAITDVENYQRCSYTHDDSWAGAKYISPMKDSCQANHIIFVSDGRPFNIGTPDGFEEITGMDSLDCHDRRLTSTDPNAWKGNCGPELADYISKNDLISSMPGSTVTVNTVGFGVSGNAVEFLADVANAGEGEFYNSQSSAELHSDLNDLFENVSLSNQSFSTFSLSVDRATASHDSRMYLPMIQPNNSTVWAGNLKGYFLDNEGIKDVDGVPATEVTSSGVQVKETARSFWTDTVDGGQAANGGAASRIDGDNRNLYTYLDDPTTLSSLGVDLSVDVKNKLVKNNPELNSNLFNNTPDLGFLLDYTRFSPMADPLHSDVVIADYAGGKRVVFTATNQGFLHAIDATYPDPDSYGDTRGGEEIFAFIPKELLPNLHYSLINEAPGEHLYGLDGNVVPWHTDANGDGIVNGEDQ